MINRAYNKDKYLYWQDRILISMIVGYALYYLTRQNLSIAMPILKEQFHFTKDQVGHIFSAFALVYGIGKFVNGFVTDQSSAKKIFIGGLLGSAFISFIMGFTFYWWLFIPLAAASGWLQSMGWPPIVKLITRWYPPSKLGTKWGITNISHQVGSVIILSSAPYVILNYGLSYAFILPALIAGLGALLLNTLIVDRPQEVGLEPILKDDQPERQSRSFANNIKEWKSIFITYILPNRFVWYVCLSTFFLYVVRMGFFFWAPMFLTEAKGINLIEAGWTTAGLELAGAFGGISAGWLSDKLFSNRRGMIGVIYMISLIICLFCFWAISGDNMWVLSFIMFCIGFFIYGGQVISGVVAADVVSKKAVSSAVGLTGTFGYIAGSIFSGSVIGFISEKWGWGVCLMLFVVSAILGAFFFSLTWSKKEEI